MNKDIIVFDVDGIILDFNMAFCNYMKSSHHIDVIYNPMNWNFEWERDSHELDEYIKKFIKTKPFIPLFDNTIVQFIDNLKLKYKIIIVTAYTDEENRRNNLKLFNIYYDDIYFVSQNDKVTVINSLNPIAVFEDCPYHINNLLESNDDIIIFTPEFWNYTKSISNPRVTRYFKFDSLLLK